MKSKKRVECPTCGESFHLDNWIRIGAQLLCPYCEEFLEVVKLKPITVNCVYSNDWENSEANEMEVSVFQKRNSRPL